MSLGDRVRDALGQPWAAAASASYPADVSANLELHRWGGTGAAVLLVLVAVLSELRRRRPSARLRLIHRAALFSAVLITGVASHFGATLVFGPTPLAW